MKKIHTIFFYFLIHTFLFADPVIQIPSGEINLGKLPQELKTSFPVMIKNVGDSDLVIDSITVSCGCTATELANKTIAPGSESEIQVTFDSGRFIGDIKKGITITSNDKNNPRLTVNFIANIYEIFESNPKYIEFDRVVRRFGKKFEIEINRVDNEKIQIKDADYNHNLFDFSWQPFMKSGKDNYVKLFLTFKPDRQITGFNERIKLNMLTDKKPDAYTIFATGMVVDNDLYIDPFNAIFFKTTDEIKNMKLKSYYNNFFIIKEIKNDISYLKVKYKKISKSEYLFTFTLDKTKKIQKFTTEISVITNYPQEEIKKIAITY